MEHVVLKYEASSKLSRVAQAVEEAKLSSSIFFHRCAEYVFLAWRKGWCYQIMEIQLDCNTKFNYACLCLCLFMCMRVCACVCSCMFMCEFHRGKGVIVNLSSGVATIPCPLYSLYSASKASKVCVCACVCACVRARARVCACAYVCVCACVCVGACI